MLTKIRNTAKNFKSAVLERLLKRDIKEPQTMMPCGNYKTQNCRAFQHMLHIERELNPEFFFQGSESYFPASLTELGEDPKDYAIYSGDSVNDLVSSCLENLEAPINDSGNYLEALNMHEIGDPSRIQGNSKRVQNIPLLVEYAIESYK
jgi:hypothetical protein